MAALQRCYVEPPAELLAPLKMPSKILMGAGPSTCSPRVLHALSLPVVGHLHQECTQVMDEVKAALCYVFQTRNTLTMAVSASGHGGMEMALSNLVEPGDVVLIPVSGLWGHRAADMAKRYGADVRLCEKAPGQNFTLEEVEKAVTQHRPAVVFMVQGESTTGVYQPLDGMGSLCHSAKVESRKSPPTVYYWDVKLLGNYWGCFNEPRRYHHTGSSNLLCALREGLALIVEEGLERCIARHQRCAEQLYAGLQKLGLELFVENDNARLPTVTSVRLPADVDLKLVQEYAAKNYSMEIAGGLGPTVGMAFRIGLLGYNATPSRVELILHVIKEGLDFARNTRIPSRL